MRYMRAGLGLGALGSRVHGDRCVMGGSVRPGLPATQPLNGGLGCKSTSPDPHVLTLTSRLTSRCFTQDRRVLRGLGRAPPAVAFGAQAQGWWYPGLPPPACPSQPLLQLAPAEALPPLPRVSLPTEEACLCPWRCKSGWLRGGLLGAIVWRFLLGRGPGFQSCTQAPSLLCCPAAQGLGSPRGPQVRIALRKQPVS